MRTEQISSGSFGLRPQLKVSKENHRFFDEVANIFDQYNKTLKCKPNDVRYYEIKQNQRGLTFTEYKDGWEHSIRFGKKLAQEFLEKTADYIAKTLADAAEIFALSDEIWFKISDFANSVAKNEKLKMSEQNQGKFTDELTGEIYDKYVLKALTDVLKENGFLARAKINL